MAEVKWIKIVTDIFDNRKIKQIEVLPDADSILVIWFKLICLAGSINDGGRVYFMENVPYTDEMLATQFRRPLNTVRMALDTFRQFGMIEIIDDFLCLPSWEKYQNAESLEKIREQNRLRQAKFKAKQRALPASNVSSNVTERYSNATEEDIDRDIDKDIEEDSLVVSNDTTRQTQSVRQAVDAWNELKVYGIKSVSKMSSDSKRYKSLMARINQYGIEGVLEAIENIKASDFLQGKNKNGWTVTFDWFVLPNNFPKVLENNYDNKVTIHQETWQPQQQKSGGDRLLEMIRGGVFDE